MILNIDGLCFNSSGYFRIFTMFVLHLVRGLSCIVTCTTIARPTPTKVWRRPGFVVTLAQRLRRCPNITTPLISPLFGLLGLLGPPGAGALG